MDVYIGVDNKAYMDFAPEMLPNVCYSYATYQNRQKPLWKPPGKMLLDSGGFVFISKHGRYTSSLVKYLAFVRKNNPDLFVSQDWTCDPLSIERTGLTVEEHIHRTVDNAIQIWGRLTEEEQKKFIPVIQGWDVKDYLECIDLYRQSGIEITYYGLGSLVRKNCDSDIARIISRVSEELGPDIKLHGFGVKVGVINRLHNHLTSIDTQAGMFYAKNRNGEWVKFTDGSKQQVLIDYYQKLNNIYQDTLKQSTLKV